jgi:hypothetical protein
MSWFGNSTNQVKSQKILINYRLEHNSPKIIHEHGSKGNRIKVLHEKNRVIDSTYKVG